MVSIYVLKLESGKFYVGKTNCTLTRIYEHLSGKGSYYTQIYKPVDIAEIIHNCDDFDEDKYVIKYMSIYGIDNVRGGSYCSEFLHPIIVKDINLRILTAKNACFSCSQIGHFSDKCSLRKNRFSFSQKPGKKIFKSRSFKSTPLPPISSPPTSISSPPTSIHSQSVSSQPIVQSPTDKLQREEQEQEQEQKEQVPRSSIFTSVLMPTFPF